MLPNAVVEAEDVEDEDRGRYGKPGILVEGNDLEVGEMTFRTEPVRDHNADVQQQKVERCQHDAQPVDLSRRHKAHLSMSLVAAASPLSM